MTTNITPIWSPSEAREAVRADLASVRQRARQDIRCLTHARVEDLLVAALRDDEPALASLSAFKDLAKKLVEAHGIPLATTWTAEGHAVEEAACRARAHDWSELAEKAVQENDHDFASRATAMAIREDRRADHHAACARGAP